MPNINLSDAKRGFSGVVEEAIKGKIMTITRPGNPVAAVVSLEAADSVRHARSRDRAGLVSYLNSITCESFTRNRSPSWTLDL